MGDAGSFRRPDWLVVLGVLVFHSALLAWGAFSHSPTWDEVAHLPAGVSHWQSRQFDLYRVNPPLVRMVAALPVVIAGSRCPWRAVSGAPGARPEFWISVPFIQAHGGEVFRLVTLARWACLPFSLVGALICLQWARRLYGRTAGLLAIVLWCFAPSILANAQLITPDVGAAALGVAAGYVFWRWLEQPRWTRAFGAGVVLGLAELTKATWIVLFGLWPLLWLLWRCPEGRALSRPEWLREGSQLGLVLVLALYVVNLGYGFEGSFQRLENYTFVSEALGGAPSEGQSANAARNRFGGTWLGALPVPIPKNYLLGIDQQKWEFERRMWSYFRGKWQLGGWWYYYLYALGIKVPLGMWVLVLSAALLGALHRGYVATRRDELVLLAPIAVVLTLVSSQTGLNHHMRYVLPIFPFAFVWASKVARAVDLKNWTLASVLAAALSWSVASSLWCYPHSLSYFNELVGGPRHGHEHLLDSNIDWGQDLLYLRRWFDQHPDARPLGVAYGLPYVDPRIAGIEYTLPPRHAPAPGWYALSVRTIRGPSREYDYFLHSEPVATAGYSIYIYHITPDEANRVRREMGLPELPEDWQASAGGTGDEPGR